jgi:two-component system response regulator YesN
MEWVQIMTVERKTKILILDDEPTSARITAKILRDELADTVEIQTTTEVARARQLINESRCDILMSDIEMPDADGLDVLRFTRASSAWTRVIMMTGNSTRDRLDEALRGGAADYLIKPLDRDQLVRVIQQEHERLRRWDRSIDSMC